MQLKHIESTVCPICGARTKYEEQKSQHCNGEWFEERGFECGARLDYVPNFSRVQEGKPCPNHPDQQRMKRRRQIALNSVFDFIAGLDVDEEFKNHLRRYL